MKKLTVLLALLALVPFAFAACGDDDDDGDTAETTPAEETTTEAGGGGGGGGGATVDVSADPGGQLAFEQSSLEAPAGSVTFEFTNDASIPHDFIIEEAGSDLAGTDTITGDSTTLDVDLEAGEYTFYCSVDAHREAGMEGTLTVK